MNNIYKHLESVIYNGIKKNPLPIKKGNSIRIGKIIIRESNVRGYILFDSELNKQIDIADSLRGAIAMTKLYLSQKDFKSIKQLDRKYSKYYNDSIFYKASIKRTHSKTKRVILRNQLEVAQITMETVSKSLEDIIFDNKR